MVSFSLQDDTETRSLSMLGVQITKMEGNGTDLGKQNCSLVDDWPQQGNTPKFSCVEILY